MNLGLPDFKTLTLIFLLYDSFLRVVTSKHLFTSTSFALTMPIFKSKTYMHASSIKFSSSPSSAGNRLFQSIKISSNSMKLIPYLWFFTYSTFCCNYRYTFLIRYFTIWETTVKTYLSYLTQFNFLNEWMNEWWLGH